MVKLTASLREWMFRNHPEELPLLYFGHLEIFTDEYKEKYLEWCKTDEGKKYLKGGCKYSDPK